MSERFHALGAERLAALLLITFSVAEFYAALKLSVSAEYTLGPGAMPIIYSVGLFIFATALLLQPSKKASTSIGAAIEAGDESEPAPSPNYRAGVILFALVAAYIASIYVIGFLGGTILFALLYLLLVARWPVMKAAAFAVLWGAGIYVLFVDVLEVQLESGILFSSY